MSIPIHVLHRVLHRNTKSGTSLQSHTKRLLLIAIALLLPQGAFGEDAAAKQRDGLYGRAKRASVEVLVDDHLQGTGWFADKSGLVVTVAHMFDRPGRRVEILSPVAGRVEAKVIAVDLGADSALLRVKPREGGYPAFPLAKEIPPPGRDVFLFGTPIYRHGVLLRGAVARNDTTFEYYGDRNLYTEIVHLSGQGPHGVSGGPWMNREGEIVGMQSGVMTNKDAPMGVAFMVPVDAIRRLLQTKRTAETPTLGVAVEETWQQQPDFLKRFPRQTEGLVAKIIQKDGPAARAKLKQWDVITAIDGKKVRMPDELLRYVRTKKPGDSVMLTVLGPDGTGQRKLDVRLGRLEAAWPAAKK